MEISNIELFRYAGEYTNEVRATSSETGESNEIEMLNTIKEGLGDSKRLNDPHFFYWKYAISSMNIELCGYDIDEVDSSLSLFAVDFGAPMHRIAKADVDKLGNRAANFVRLVLSENKIIKNNVENEALDLYDIILDLKKSPQGISKVRVFIVSNGLSILRNSEVKASIKETQTDVEYILWDIKWIYENCKMQKEHESIVLDFADEELVEFVSGGIPYLQVPQADKNFDCYQCVVPGTLLSHIYRKYGSTLLEGNVRSFLTSKTAVNKKIQETIQKSPRRFYVYNNGIAAVASAVKTSEEGNGSKIVQIDDIQIINGGQTTASLAYAERKRGCDLSEIFVPMKLTVVHPEDGDVKKTSELIQKISETSNSQNKVSDADFFANHPFHSLMKKFSLDLAVPGLSFNTYWFYERARGEYVQETAYMTDSQKKAFIKQHPKSMYLTKVDFAKFYGLYNMQPDMVSKGGGTNFNDFAKKINKIYDENRESQFNEVFFKEITGVAKLYRAIEPMISINKQSWYGGGYRANIINYALSLFFYLVKEQSPENDFDLTVLWGKDVSESLLNQLLELCHLVYDQLIDENRPEVNVTQWAKKSDCWKEMKSKLGNVQIDLISIKGYLQNKSISYERKKEAKLDQQLQNEVSVYNIAFDDEHRKKWVPLFEFVMLNKYQFSNLTRSEEVSLERMSRSMKGSRVAPTTSDCQVALRILEEAELVGFGG